MSTCRNTLPNFQCSDINVIDETVKVIFNQKDLLTDNKDETIWSSRACILLANGYFRLNDVNGTNISQIVSKYIDNGKFEFRITADHRYRMILFPERQKICVNFTKLDTNRCVAKGTGFDAEINSYCFQCGVIGLKKTSIKTSDTPDLANISKFLDIFKNKLNLPEKTHVSFDEIANLKALNDNGFDETNIKTYYIDCVRSNYFNFSHKICWSSCNFGVDENYQFLQLSKFVFNQGDSVMIELKRVNNIIVSFYKISNFNFNDKLLIGDGLTQDCFDKGEITLDDEYEYILGFGTAGCDCDDLGGNLHTVFV